MALSIKNDEADRLARELAALAGESLTEAIVKSLRERLERQRAARGGARPSDLAMAIGRRFAARAAADKRPLDEILGYDERGLAS